MKIFLGVALLATLFASNVSALNMNLAKNDYEKVYYEVLVDEEYKKISEIADRKIESLRLGTIPAESSRKALENLVSQCGSSINYTFTDSTGATKTVNLFSYVLNASEYIKHFIKKKNYRRVAQYIIFTSKPVNQAYKDLISVSGIDNKERQLRFVNWMLGLAENKSYDSVPFPFEPLRGTVNYVCNNNNSTDYYIGLSSTEYKNFVYYMSIKDYEAVNKILDKVDDKSIVTKMTPLS